jgi:proteasome lid subunit RPN8/RPN11
VNKAIKDVIMNHCASEYPDEGCGFIVWAADGLKVVSTKNISDTKKTNFKFDPIEYLMANRMGTIVGIFHSHPDETLVELSEEDIKVAKEYNLPIYAFSYPDTGYDLYIPDNFSCHLLGRPFAENIFDCLSLIRDFYHYKFNIKFPFVPYEIDWMEQGKTYFEEYYESFGFVKVEEPKPDDIILFTIKGKVAHAAILFDYNTLLHHSENKLSCREPLDPRLLKFVYGYFRHKTLL